MNQQQDIRWIQRFSNFKKALSQLTKFIEKKKLNELEKQGLIKAFEYTYELAAWNTMKDYLEYQGYTDIKGSRDAIQFSFKIGLISSGTDWMEMFKSRNQTNHTYNEATAQAICDAVFNRYFELSNKLHKKLNTYILA